MYVVCLTAVCMVHDLSRPSEHVRLVRPCMALPLFEPLFRKLDIDPQFIIKHILLFG